MLFICVQVLSAAVKNPPLLGVGMVFRERYHIFTPCKSDVAITNIWFYTGALRRRFIKQKCCVYAYATPRFP